MNKEIKLGLLAGLCIVVLKSIAYADNSSYTTFMKASYMLCILIPLPFVYLYHKDTIFNDASQALKTSLKLVAIAALISVVGEYFLYEWRLEQLFIKMVENKPTLNPKEEAQKVAYIQEIQTFKYKFSKASIMLFTYLLVGFIFSLFSTSFLAKRRA